MQKHHGELELNPQVNLFGHLSVQKTEYSPDSILLPAAFSMCKQK